MGAELTANGERGRHSVVPTDEGVFCRVLFAGVHDLQLVELSLNNDAELLAHLDLHAIPQPRGRHVEVGNLTLEGGRLGLGHGRVLHGSDDLQGCNRVRDGSVD